MDRLDAALLDCVQRDNRRSHADLGREVGLSASSVRRRLERMRANGTIAADVSLVAPDPSWITGIVHVAFERETLDNQAAFRQRMLASPEVTQCYAVSGDTDFVLVVHARSLAAYEAWGHRVLMADPMIRRYDTFVVYSRVKFTTALPVLPSPS